MNPDEPKFKWRVTITLPDGNATIKDIWAHQWSTVANVYVFYDYSLPLYAQAVVTIPIERVVTITLDRSSV